MFNVTFENTKTQAWMDKLTKVIPEIGANVVNRTSAYGLSQVKTTVSKRSGTLGNSYKLKINTPVQHVIYSPSKYADSVETGYKAHTVYPSAGHTFLTIPLNNSVMTNTKAQIKKASMDKLFKVVGYNKKSGKLYAKDKERTVKQEFDDVGIALARKANIPAFRGTHKIRDIVMPKINKKFIDEVNYYVEKVL